ncbi:MAG: hypothetical protein Q8P18_24985 [Pseudomonadota bacterium]|nr:hypothetical protein [Pseudomonadota bacterium]
MAEFGTVLTLVGSVCCCISVFLVAMIGFSFAFRPKRARGADVKGMAPAPVRGVATQASLTRMEEDRVDSRQPPAGPQVSRSAPGRPSTPARPAAPAASPATPPPGPSEIDATVRQATPSRPPPSLGKGPPPFSTSPPPFPGTPPPAPPAAPPPLSSGPPPVPDAPRPPPIPPGTRLLLPSPTIAPGSGDEPPPPPPRKV